MSEEPSKPIDLPIAPKDIFRILALRSVVEQPAMVQKLLDNFDLIFERIPRTPRLDPRFPRNPFDYEHTGRTIVNAGFGEFTERELCASDNAFFGHTLDGIGTVIDYELPLDETKDSALGKIDLVSLTNNGELFLLEVKKVKSNEHPLRAMFEIFTFWKMLMDEEGTFDRFLEQYKQCPQFPKDGRFNEKELKVLPGLLLCETSDVRNSLVSDKMKPTEKELFGRFLSDKIGLRVFSYSEKNLSVRNITDTVKRNCGVF